VEKCVNDWNSVNDWYIPPRPSSHGNGVRHFATVFNVTIPRQTPTSGWENGYCFDDRRPGYSCVKLQVNGTAVERTLDKNEFAKQYWKLE
jgi:hypothetical protein